MNRLIIAFSGGKDSTALALRLAALGERFELLHTATGNELPGVAAHIARVCALTRAPLINLSAPTLAELILEQGCLPNWRMRWCTRMIKIEPCLNWIRENPKITLAVGLRADEPGRLGADYPCGVIYPLRDWGWDEAAVLDFVKRQSVSLPERTDCAVCFYQTLHEWWSLWKYHRRQYAEGESWEKFTGHTFRSPRRDSQPASLRDLRKKFEQGYFPRRTRRTVVCRVCAPNK